MAVVEPNRASACTGRLETTRGLAEATLVLDRTPAAGAKALWDSILVVVCRTGGRTERKERTHGTRTHVTHRGVTIPYARCIASLPHSTPFLAHQCSAPMAFVALGGDDATRPTFFETLAAGQLVPSLRAAIVYTLSVSKHANALRALGCTARQLQLRQHPRTRLRTSAGVFPAALVAPQSARL